MKKVLLGCAVCLAANIANASEVNFFPHNVDVIGLRVYAGENPGHFVKVSPVGYFEGCEITKETEIYYLPSGSTEAYSMLLTAKAANQQVRLVVKGYDECFNGYTQITEVQLGDW